MLLTGVRLPTDVERGAVGGPRFNTTVLELDSGFEKRNINWSEARGEWDVGYGILQKFDKSPEQTELDLEELKNIFWNALGKANSFRFKDWFDYEIGFQDGAQVDAQFLALGDDTTTLFQVFKRYEVSTFTYDRPLTKLVGGTVQVLVEGVDVTGTTTIDLDRATVDLQTAPASTGGSGSGGEEVVTIRCEFDAHVRFDTDDLKVNMEVYNAGDWASIPLVELRETGVD